MAAPAERADGQAHSRRVKGAYWDSEIKWAQERGLEDYPVFSRKMHTDVSYLAAMRLLIADQTAFYPQFATHNAHSIAAAAVAGGAVEFEYQRLHGMGEALYEQVVGEGKFGARAGFMLLSVDMKICSAIWCVVCLKTGPTLRSSIAWVMKKRRSPRS